MFNFIVKKGLYNLVLHEYTVNLDVFKKELINIYNSNYSDENQIDYLICKSTQKYYTTVFDSVCNNISKNDFKFKTILGLKISTPSLCGFPCDVDKLFPGDIYAFAYWVATNNKVSAAKYKEINIAVYEMQSRALVEIFKQ